MTGPPTLADLLRVGHDFSTWCPRCQTHGETLHTEALIATLGEHATVADVERRLRCTRCGHRGGEARVSVRGFNPRL